MLKKLFRVAFTLVGCLLGYGAFLLGKYIISLSGTGLGVPLTRWQELGVAGVIVLLFGLIFFKLVPALNRQGKKVANTIETDLQTISVNEIVSGTAGLLIGLIIAFLISRVYGLIRIPYVDVVLSIITYLILGYFGVIIATRKSADLITMFTGGKRQSAGGGNKSRNKGLEATPKILDTSVIIDGRILEIMETGFLEGTVVIPEFVLVELRHIADSSDGLKRTRGRRGLDILNKIQTEYGIEIYNTTGEKALEEIPEVDVKLLKLAQMVNGKVVTNDFNLNKVAGIKGVSVLNINELANTLKPVVLPGEAMKLFLVKEGKERDQAVAYLDDGTMIVVEEGRKYIGKTIRAEVSSVLQTSAGRMIFAKPMRNK